MLEKKSFHGSLIKVIVEEWSSRVLFEQIDSKILNKLQSMLESYIPTIEAMVTWNIKPEDIDRQLVNGGIFFIDENNNKKVIHFTVLNTKTIINENEKN